FVALLASYLCFAHGIHRSRRWLWIAGGTAVIAFAIRPFAAATIASEAFILLISGAEEQPPVWSRGRAICSFIVAFVFCARLWLWLTVLHPKPWMLSYYEYRLRNYFMLVPVWTYLTGGLLAPAIYLGIVLSPLAIVHALQYWRRSLVIIGLIVASALIVMHLG